MNKKSATKEHHTSMLNNKQQTAPEENPKACCT
jgi:hypothetical protein